MHKALAKAIEAFTKDCIVERAKSIDDTIHRNKLKLFGAAKPKGQLGKAAVGLTEV